MTLKTQVGKESFLQKKLNVQNNVIEELQCNLSVVEKRNQYKITNEIESLMTEMVHLEKENEQKRTMLDEIDKENFRLEEKLQILEAKCNQMAEENLMKHEEDEISLNDELHTAGKLYM
jgi:hypothetical protein